MNRSIKSILTILSIVLLVVAAVLFLMKQKAEIAAYPTPEKPHISVTLSKMREGSLKRTQSFLAIVASDHSAIIASKLSGHILSIDVKEGMQIKAGTLIASIDDTQTKTSLASLRSSQAALQQELQHQQAIHARNIKLYEAKALAQEQLNASRVALAAIQSRVDNLTQQIEALENQLDYLHLKAPFTGTVAAVYLHQGDLATPGKALVKINAPQKKLTFSFVSEPIAEGQSVYHNDKKIGHIATHYDDAKQGLKVAEVTLEQSIDYVDGEKITIDVGFGDANGCVVDSRAILYNGNKASLLIYQKEHFSLYPVQVRYVGISEAIVTPCLQTKVAVASQSKLALLPHYSNVTILEE